MAKTKTKKKAKAKTKRPAKRKSAKRKSAKRKRTKRRPAAPVKKPGRERRHFARVKPGRFDVKMGPPGSVGHGIKYVGFDLGMYGLSFLLPRDTTPPVKIGMTIDGMTFELKGRTIQVDGRVQYMKRSRAKGGPPLKAGVEFTRIDPADIFYIAQVISTQISPKKLTHLEITLDRTKV